MDKAVKITIIIAVLIIAMSVAYYLVVFLPHEEQMSLNQKQQALQDTKKAANQKALDLEFCLSRADSDGSSFWDSECESQGLGKNCSLPEFNANRVDNSIKEAKSECFKQYPQ